MEELKIYKFQLEHLKDTLRLVANAMGSRAKKTSVDRDVMEATEMVENALSGQIDKRVNRF